MRKIDIKSVEMSSDYHLSSKDSTKVEKMVPISQRQVFMAFNVSLEIDNKEFKEAVIALSEHYICLFKRSFMGGISPLENIHILDLNYIGVPNRHSVTLKLDGRESEREIKIKSEEKPMRRFSLCLFRNYYLITSYLPPDYRAKFDPKHPEDFPQFNPRLSPGQQFQFLFYAYCTQDNQRYNHCITQWVNFTSITMSGVFDFGKLPYHEIENSFASSLNLQNCMDALSFFPTLYGIVIRNVGRSDFFELTGQLLEQSKTCRIFVAESNNIVDGIEFLAQAIVNNRDLPLQYLDISDNPIRDMLPICQAVSHLKADLFYLDFSNTNLSEKAYLAFLESYKSNTHLWHIKYLNMGGAKCTSAVIDAYKEVFRTLTKHQKVMLKFFSPGIIKGSVSELLQLLLKYQGQVRSVSLTGTKISKKDGAEIMTFVSHAESLHEINLSNTGIKPEIIAEIIKIIAFKSILGFNLNLSGLKLNGKKLAPVTEAFKKYCTYSWGRLSFDNNKMGSEDVMNLVKALKKCTSVEGISLNNNLNYKMKNLDEVLPSLIQFKGLKYLSIQGGKNALGPMLAPYIRMVANTEIETFNPSFNYYGEEGIDAIGDLIENSVHLQTLHVDGSGTSDAIAIVKLLDNIKKSNSIRVLPFPYDDVYNIMKAVSKSKSKQLYQMLTVKQLDAQAAIMRNQTAVGIKTELTELEYNPELNDLVQHIIDVIREKLGSQLPYEHSAINKAFKMPFPHLEDNEEADVEEHPMMNDGADAYKTPELSGVVREADNDAVLISTYNSTFVGDRTKREPVPANVAAEVLDLPIYDDIKPSQFPNFRNRGGDDSSDEYSSSSSD